MKIHDEICLTDSELVLNWIQRVNKDYKQYVQNRVVEIRLNTSISSWYHVRGEEIYLPEDSYLLRWRRMASG